MERPTHSDIWRKLGEIDAKLDRFSDRLNPVEKFASDYQADKNRILGAMAGIALLSVLIVAGFKAWVASWFPS